MAATRYCPKCGLDRREGERFCRNCGTPLGTGETRLHDSPGHRSGGEPTTPLAPSSAAANLPPPPPAPAPITAPVGVASPAPIVAPAGAARSSLPFKPIALVGGVGLAVSAFLPWVSNAGGSTSGLDVPIEALWSLQAGDSAVKVGFVVLALGALGAVLSFVPRSAWARRLCGSASVAVVLAFTAQLYRAVDQFGGTAGDLFDLIGFGVYVAFLGAVGLSASR